MRFCAHCGKEIMDEAVICLHCGCKVQIGENSAFNVLSTASPQIIDKENKEPQLAFWAKICGIVSFFIGWFALGITAIVLACMSRDETDGNMCFSAKIGLVCGIVSTALSGVLVFVVIVSLITLSFI